MEQFKEIPLKKIQGPEIRDRIAVDSDLIQALAEDIQANGLINPILVRPKDSYFEVVAGERRFLAVQSLGWERVACHVQNLDDVSAAVLRGVENLGREDLSPIEEAYIYHRFVEEFGFTRDQVANRFKKSPGVVRRRLDLLRMPESVQKSIHLGQISYGVAEELVRFQDPGKIDYYLGICVDHGATVAVVRQWVEDERRAARTPSADVGESGGVFTPGRVVPSYIACGICEDPVELGKEVVLRICPLCFEKIKAALRG